VGSLTNLNWSVSEQSLWKWSTICGRLVFAKFGPSGSRPAGVSSGSKPKMFPISAALIFVSFGAVAALDEVPTNVVVPPGAGSGVGRSMKRSFLVGDT